MQRERDHLVRQNRDSVDSKTSTNEEIQKMRSEIELQRKTYEAQFIEYVSKCFPTFNKTDSLYYNRAVRLVAYCY